MDYELAKRLKDTGFPQKHLNLWDDKCDKEHSLGMATECCGVYIPTLSELIEACGDKITSIERIEDKWRATWLDKVNRGTTYTPCFFEDGETPEVAVANLWVELNKNK